MTAKGHRLRPEASTGSEASDLTAGRGRQATPGLGAGRGAGAAPHLGLRLPPPPFCPMPGDWPLCLQGYLRRPEQTGGMAARLLAHGEVQGRRGGLPDAHRPVCWWGQCQAVGNCLGAGLPSGVRVRVCVCTCVFAHGCACAPILRTWHQRGNLGHSPGQGWEGGVQGRPRRSQAVTSSGCLGQPQSPARPRPCCGLGAGAGGTHRTAPALVMRRPVHLCPWSPEAGGHL